MDHRPRHMATPVRMQIGSSNRNRCCEVPGLASTTIVETDVEHATVLVSLHLQHIWLPFGGRGGQVRSGLVRLEQRQRTVGERAAYDRRGAAHQAS